MKIMSCLERQLVIGPAALSDYHQLSMFHYCGDGCGPIRKIYKMVEDHVSRRLCAGLVGVIVYGMPSANLAVRNRATNGAFCGLSRADGLKLLNKNMLCIRRVIIEPRYRGLGLATRLVRETLGLTASPLVEAVSVMGRVHPFFAHAGMQVYESTPDAKAERLRTALESVGIDSGTWHRTGGVHAAINALPEVRRAFVLDEIDHFAQKFTSQRNKPHSLERTGFVLSRLTAEPIYYLWRNPVKNIDFSLLETGEHR